MKAIKFMTFGISLSLAGIAFGTNNFIAMILAALGTLIVLAGCFVKEK